MKRTMIGMMSGLICLASASLVFAGGAKEAGQTEPKVVYSQDFETGLGGFKGRSAETVSRVKGPAHSGDYAVAITKRKMGWNGPFRDFTTTLRLGNNYHLRYWAFFKDGPEVLSLSLSVQKTTDQGQVFEQITGAKVPRGQWTLIEADYSVRRDKTMSDIGLYLESNESPATTTDLTTFYIDDVQISQLPPPPPQSVQGDLPSLWQAYKAYFPIGVAVHSSLIQSNDIHAAMIKQHYNALVYGNEMKPDTIQRTEGVFNFAPGDDLITYAAKNKMLVRGHTLLWHQQTPAWFFQDPKDSKKKASKEVLYARLKKHIQTTVGHFKGKIYAWDVCNEVFNDNGTPRSGKEGSQWYDIVGSLEYVEKAFEWAREADPAAILVLNDFNQESSAAKREAMYQFVKQAIAKGIPIDAVGLQMHISIAQPSLSEIRATIERYASLGVKVQVTEMDVSMYSSDAEAKKPATAAILREQAKRYQDIFEIFKSEAKAGKLNMVMIWGIADDNTWLDNHPVMGRLDAPMPFDRSLQAKPAFWGLVDPSKLPVYINKAVAYSTDSSPKDAADPMWAGTPRTSITDSQGGTKASFATLFDAKMAYLKVDVIAGPASPADAIQVFVDPQNLKAKTWPTEAFGFSLSRSGARSQAAGSANGSAVTTQVVETKTGWTAVFGVPLLAGRGRPAMDLGIDLKLSDASGAISWNDSTQNQDKTAETWGSVVFEAAPSLAIAPRGTPSLSSFDDPLWAKVATQPVARRAQGKGTTAGTFRALWDDKFLYVLTEVRDADVNLVNKNPWEQDSVEVFIDENNHKTGVYEADDGQYRVNAANAASFNGGDSSKFQSLAKKTDYGYVVLQAVPLTLGAPQNNQVVGFDVQINDADSSGNRVGIISWYDTSNSGYRDTSHYGLIRLQAAN